MGHPLFFIASALSFYLQHGRPSGYMDKEATPEVQSVSAWAHGSIQGFGSEGDASNYVGPRRAEDAAFPIFGYGRLAPADADQ